MTSARRALGRVVRPLRRLYWKVVLRIEERSESRLARRIAASAPSANSREGHVLIVAPGGGSVGDEAMLQAFVSNVPGPVLIVARSEKDLLSPLESYQHVEPLPDLLYGGLLGRRRDLRRLLGLVSRARSISVIGADVMDGAYQVHTSVRRFRTASLGTVVGAEARITGFSWRRQPAPEAIRAMRLASDHVRLYARDPVTQERLEADGAAEVHLSADLAFLTAPSPAPPAGEVGRWVAEQQGRDRPLVILNANPVLERTFPNQPAAYRLLIERLLARGYACLMLPHDSRGGADGEIAYQAKVAADVVDDAFLRSESIIGPGEVVTLAAGAKFVVSGRMHLAILSSCAGTPVLGLEYQDKFEGLYSLLGYPGRVPLALNSDIDDLAAFVENAIDGIGDSRERLDERLPELRRLATGNLPE